MEMTQVSQKQCLEAFGERLRGLREECGKSREEVAIFLRLTAGQIYRMERGEVDPGLFKLVRLSGYFGVSPLHFFPPQETGS